MDNIRWGVGGTLNELRHGAGPLYYTEKVEKIVENVLFSAYVKARRPLSLIVIAPPGAGKTDIIRQYSKNKCVRLFNSFTPSGLVKSGTLASMSRGKVRTLLVSELGMVFQYRANRGAQILFFNQLTEEGISEISTHFMVVSYSPPARCGIIGAMTDREFESNRALITNMGFLSRALCVYYTYAPYVQKRIMQKSRKDKSDEIESKTINLPRKPQEVECKVKYIKKLEGIIYRLNKKMILSTSQRIRNRLLTFLMANALRHGRNSVNKKDLRELYGMLHMFYDKKKGPYLIAIKGKCLVCGRSAKKICINCMDTKMFV